MKLCVNGKYYEIIDIDVRDTSLKVKLSNKESEDYLMRWQKSIISKHFQEDIDKEFEDSSIYHHTKYAIKTQGLIDERFLVNGMWPMTINLKECIAHFSFDEIIINKQIFKR